MDGQCQRIYESVDDFRQRRAPWLAEHGIEFVDVTAEAIEFHAHYRRGEVDPSRTQVEGGTDVAFKNNLGLALTHTEWTIPNWDCDFFAGPGWDRPLVDYARSVAASDRVMLVPMHVQPRPFAEIPVWTDPWTSARAVASNVLGMPTTRSLQVQPGADPCPWVTSEDFAAFCVKMARPGVILEERPGVRSLLHWVPAMLRTSDLLAVGGYSLIGCGYDLEIDNRLGERGFRKVGFCDSFQLHKGFPPI